MNSLIFLLTIVCAAGMYLMGLQGLAVAILLAGIFLSIMFTPQGARSMFSSNPFEGLPPPNAERVQKFSQYLRDGFEASTEHIKSMIKPKKDEKTVIVHWENPLTGTTQEVEILKDNELMFNMLKDIYHKSPNPKAALAIAQLVNKMKKEKITEKDIEEIQKKLGLSSFDLLSDDELGKYKQSIISILGDLYNIVTGNTPSFYHFQEQ